VSFTEQRDQLVERKKELDKSAEKIRELIKVLDGRKVEDIERTFKQVAKNFSDVFGELVPNGRGKLVMLRAEHTEPADAEEEPMAKRRKKSKGKKARPSTEAMAIEDYAGVAIRVSFTGGAEALRMQQLSGGQKSVVALALIFAIQRCDPAPFYLFDEIDSALDPIYRTSVANLIKKQASGENQTQFLITVRTSSINWWVKGPLVYFRDLRSISKDCTERDANISHQPHFHSHSHWRPHSHSHPHANTTRRCFAGSFHGLTHTGTHTPLHPLTLLCRTADVQG
jgi:RecF/RecN/SMC family protein